MNSSNINDTLNSLKVLCGTWNVGDFQPNLKLKQNNFLDLTGWIEIPNVDWIPQIIVLGFQELLNPYKCIFKTKRLVPFNNTKYFDSLIYENWFPHIQAALKKKFPECTYNVEVIHRYLGLGIIVLSLGQATIPSEVVLNTTINENSNLNNNNDSNSLHCEIKSISIGSIGVGAFGFYGNKGAVAVGLELEIGNEPNHFKLCFVSSHLHAFPGINNFVERNEQVNYIFDCIVLTLVERKEADKAIIYNNGRENWKWMISRKPSNEIYSKIEDYDMCILMGDMNYRLLQKNIEDHEEVTGYVKQNKYNDLLVYDELKHIRLQKSFREMSMEKMNNKTNKKENKKETEDVKDREIVESPMESIKNSIMSITDQLFNEQLFNDELKNIWELLNKCIENNPVKLYNPFLGFSEACINFPPSYKYKTATKEPFIDYDFKTYGPPVYSKKRIPAYTDRILFRAQSPMLNQYNLVYWQNYNKMVVNVMRYDCDRRLMASDHKPVSASLLIHWKLLNKYQGDFPKIKISPEKELELDAKLNDESEPLIKRSYESYFFFNPWAICLTKLQRIWKKCKLFIINILICFVILIYLYIYKK